MAGLPYLTADLWIQTLSFPTMYKNSLSNINLHILIIQDLYRIIYYIIPVIIDSYHLIIIAYKFCSSDLKKHEKILQHQNSVMYPSYLVISLPYALEYFVILHIIVWGFLGEELKCQGPTRRKPES